MANRMGPPDIRSKVHRRGFPWLKAMNRKGCEERKTIPAKMITIEIVKNQNQFLSVIKITEKLLRDLLTQNRSPEKNSDHGFFLLIGSDTCRITVGCQ